jgi:osmotically-inducible protein OsmY
MQTRNGKVILMMCAVLSVGLMPVAWMRCVGCGTHESAKEEAEDSVITTKQKAAFAKEPSVSAMAASGETFKGLTQLSGFVEAQIKKGPAPKILPDLKSVTNSLIVRAN